MRRGPGERNAPRAGEVGRVARELASIILRQSVGASRADERRCASCRRTPLVGELMHVLASERTVCSLCLGRVPEDEREPVRSERVHASERRLAVVQRAA
jgi:hypothetical protein